MRVKSPINSRHLAFEILQRIDHQHDIPSSEIVLSRIRQSGLDERDCGLIKEIVSGVLRHRLLLDYIINQYIKGKKPPQPILRQILRIGAYQLLFLDRIPAHAAVNEAVRSTISLFNKRASGYVNAILRRISEKSLEHFPLPDKKKDFALFLSIRHSHPLWMVKHFLKEFGKQKTEELLEFNNKPAPISFRINTLKTSRETVIKWIRTSYPDCEIHEGTISPQAIHVQNISIQNIKEMLEKGWIYIQDEAAQIIGYIASPKPSMKIIDYCSAPGGKITHMAELTHNTADLIALDSKTIRLQKIEVNCKRLGIQQIRIDKITPIILDKLQKQPADLVLVDVPCSGLGIIRRQPDIKWKKTRNGITRLPALQLKILTEASRLVKKGGILIYSTCTLNKMENEDVVRSFRKDHPEFLIDKILLSFCKTEQSFCIRDGFFCSFPPDSCMDGFFCARLIKS